MLEKYNSFFAVNIHNPCLPRLVFAACLVLFGGKGALYAQEATTGAFAIKFPGSSPYLSFDTRPLWENKLVEQEILAFARHFDTSTQRDIAQFIPVVQKINQEKDWQAAELLVAKSLSCPSAYIRRRARVVCAILLQHKGLAASSVAVLESVILEEAASAPGPTLIQDLYNLGAAYGESGAFDEELQAYQCAMTIANREGDNAEVLPILLRMAATFFDLGKYELSASMYAYCIRHKDQLRADLISDAALGMSRVERTKGNLANAIDWIDVSNQYLHKRTGNYRPIRNLLELVEINIDLRQFARAESMLLGDDDWTGPSPDSGLYFRHTGLLALVHWGLGRIDSALPYLRSYEGYAARHQVRGAMYAILQAMATLDSDAGVQSRADSLSLLALRSQDLTPTDAPTQAQQIQPLFSQVLAVRGHVQNRNWTKGFILFMLIIIALLLRHRRYRSRPINQPALQVLAHSPVEIGDAQEHESLPAETDAGLKFGHDAPQTPSAAASLEAMRIASKRAIAQPEITFKQIICAKSWANRYIVLYLDAHDNFGHLEVNGRKKGSLRISGLETESEGWLLDCNRGFLINPLFFTLTADKAAIKVTHADAAAFIILEASNRTFKKGKAGQKPPQETFFGDYPIRIATTPGKNFETLLTDWYARFGVAFLGHTTPRQEDQQRTT